jgi:hypothetical protein
MPRDRLSRNICAWPRRRSMKTIGGQSCRRALGNRWKALPTF